MTAPNLRPTAATDATTPMETGPEQQLEHLSIRIPAVEGETMDAGAARIATTLRGHGVDPSSLVPLAVGEEPLTKVLPAGGPLLATWWTCSICGYSKPGGPPAGCQDSPVGHPDFARPDCPLNHPPA